MPSFEHVLSRAERAAQYWLLYAFDSLLAAAGSLLVTGIIAIFHLYPRIPNISMVYLIVVLALACTRGRYAAIFASLVAFLAFDFFIVPPLYTFVIYQAEEWIALCVFLLNALLIGHLTSVLRQQAHQAAQREHETRILYDLVQVTTREENGSHQLQSMVQAIVGAFAAWGVYDCALLQANQENSADALRVEVSAYQPVEQVLLSADERVTADWVMTHGRGMVLYDPAELPAPTLPQRVRRVLFNTKGASRELRHAIRFLPLKIGQKVVGVLRLCVLDGSSLLQQQQRFEAECEQPDARMTFFRTFLDQAAALIERARLRQENLHIEVLQRTDALRVALLSSVSHDLRTPLTVIKASASALLQEDVTWDEEARRGFALSIEREADRLNRLVGNLLDMSRIENGALQPEKDLYQVRSVIQDVFDRLQPLLHERLVRMDLAADLPPVELDYLQVDQVLTNLIENAVRYTPTDSPIEVSAWREHGAVVMCIADRGPGIPREDLERIFDKFYRVLHAKSAVMGEITSGSGLGLAVCKGLIEAHGGKIWAEQRPEGGASFFVSLPGVAGKLCEGKDV